MIWAIAHFLGYYSYCHRMLKALNKYPKAPKGRFLTGLALVLSGHLMILNNENTYRYAHQIPISNQLRAVSNEDQLDPTDFTAEELQYLERRFGVHGPQPLLAQLFFESYGQFAPVRHQTLSQLENLRFTLLSDSARLNINPMLVAAVLYEEMQLAKPVENHPIAAHSGLFRTHGPAQLSVQELVYQGKLPKDPSAEEITQGRNQLLDPHQNVRILIGKIVRLKRELGLPLNRELQIINSPKDAKGIAMLAYLYNGKSDYPRRVLRHMQDPELHGIIYSQRSLSELPLI